MKYRKLLTNVIQQIESIQNVEVLHSKIGLSEMDESTVNMIYEGFKRRLKLDLPKEFIDFFAIGDGYELNWMVQREEIKITGEFSIVDMLGVLSMKMNIQLWNSDMIEKEIQFYKSLQIIDDHPFSGDGQYSAFRMEEGVLPSEIWFVDRDAKFELNLDYAGYLEAILETRAMHGWQYFYLKDYEILRSNDYDFNRAKRHMKNVLDGFRLIFNNDVLAGKYNQIYIDLIKA